MSAAAWIELIVLVLAVGITAPLLGKYMAKVFGGDKAPGDRFFLPVERFGYRLMGVDPEREQTWQRYAVSLKSVLTIARPKRRLDCARED